MPIALVCHERVSVPFVMTVLRSEPGTGTPPSGSHGRADRNDRGGSDNGQAGIVDPELPIAESAVVAYGSTLRGSGGVDIRV
jgi:hypothetical protein